MRSIAAAALIMVKTLALGSLLSVHGAIAALGLAHRPIMTHVMLLKDLSNAQPLLLYLHPKLILL